MSRRFRFAAAALLLLTASGCGDNAAVLIHDCLVFWNEVCDYMLLANDDESAKRLLDAEFKCLKLKHENIKDRLEKRLKNPDQEVKDEYNGAWLDYYDEKVATGKRLYNSLERLDSVMQELRKKDNSASTEFLTKLHDWPKTYLFAGSADGNPSWTGKDGGPGTFPRWGDGLVPHTFPKDKNKGWIGAPLPGQGQGPQPGPGGK